MQLRDTTSPFVLEPATTTIPANSDQIVKITFTPDHESDHYFDVMLLDIPNQIEPKKIYLRGQAYKGRTFFMRTFSPFEWRPEAELRKKYEEPLKMLLPPAAVSNRRRIDLEFARDEDVEEIENEFEKAKNRKRVVLVGNCRLLDPKMEKPGNYEIAPPVSNNIN